MDREETKRILEALLFVSDKPVSIDTLRDVIKEVEATEVRSIIEELNKEYASSGRSFHIREIAGGFQMLTDPVYSRWISALYKKTPDRLTGPSLETLAIIAYKQPITRADIEAIRGVNVDGVLRTLEERGLIRTKGRLDAPGRPILYGTTNEFLQHFGLRSLDELPKLKEFQESDLDFTKEKSKTEVVDTSTGKLYIQQTAPADVDTVPSQNAPTLTPEADANADVAAAEGDIKKENVNGSEETAEES
ncbi:MAG: SMC-Scp complex subunit ScpB [Candidatus Omnitrophica bacterium]|nr:SMC-Scp complex subunit ScpB [Candidatus Omnitrophota bacterium]MCM8790859.1 SMC-Scp complex subunit ScpB [Candidatus Omnitrophota bacterium]